MSEATVVTETTQRHAGSVFALVGNPNTGKSTLFGALTGVRQKIANFPGVTVEAKIGHRARQEGSKTFVDLPGTYSLAARSPDERVAIEALLGRTPEVPAPQGVILVVDAGSLDRNLYLATQVLELGLPTVVALTMGDVAEKRGIQVDAAALSRALGVPVVPINAPRGEGIDALIRALDEVERPEPLRLGYPEAFASAVSELEAVLASRAHDLGWQPRRADALRLLVDGEGPLLEEVRQKLGGEIVSRREALRAEAGGGRAPSLVEAQTRYGQIAEWVRTCRRKEDRTGVTWTERVDAILTHKLWGTLVFVVVMGVLFQSIFSWSGYFMDLMEAGVGQLAELVSATLPEGLLQGLIVDGILGGVAGVLVFLPQILILFAFIAVLEDLGYMTRAAFLMDNLMARFSLSGRSFIPLLSSFACAVPGIMGARVVEDRPTRLTTIFLAPFMSCSARLPVYTLMIGAFIPSRTVLGFLELQGLVLFAMYFVGILAAIPTAWVVQRLLLKGHRSPFLLELPSYKVPRLKSVVLVLWQRGGAFVRRAGTIILAVSIVVWALATFPRSEGISLDYAAQIANAETEYEQRLDQLAETSGLATDGRGLLDDPDLKRALEDGATKELAPPRRRVFEEIQDARSKLETTRAALENDERADQLEHSYLGRAGHLIEPAVRPLGWDWRIGMATLASFPAREVIVATLGTIFHIGAADEESDTLKGVLRKAQRPDGSRLFTLATGLSIMVFFALCAQCAATLATMRRETNSWRWPLASFFYMTSLAYIAALAVYQITTAVT
ncbi:MAG: ferrous iron transport protein B [Planctomycetota bacterium]